jgi:hypothetical protein
MAPTTSDRPEARERPRYVRCQRPRCPVCGSVRLLAYRTCQNGDGTLTRYAKCQECGQRLLIIVE